MVTDLRREHPRALAEKVAGVLGGRTVNVAGLAGFVSSAGDPFLNHLFATGSVAPGAAAAALQGRPGFVWLDDESAAGDVRESDAAGSVRLVMQRMVAHIARAAARPAVGGRIAGVRTAADLDAWHGVYCEAVASGGSADFTAVSQDSRRVEGLPAQRGSPRRRPRHPRHAPPAAAPRAEPQRFRGIRLSRMQAEPVALRPDGGASASGAVTTARCVAAARG